VRRVLQLVFRVHDDGRRVLDAEAAPHSREIRGRQELVADASDLRASPFDRDVQGAREVSALVGLGRTARVEEHDVLRMFFEPAHGHDGRLREFHGIGGEGLVRGDRIAFTEQDASRREEPVALHARRVLVGDAAQGRRRQFARAQTVQAVFQHAHVRVAAAREFRPRLRRVRHAVADDQHGPLRVRCEEHVPFRTEESRQVEVDGRGQVERGVLVGGPHVDDRDGVGLREHARHEVGCGHVVCGGFDVARPRGCEHRGFRSVRSRREPVACDNGEEESEGHEGQRRELIPGRRIHAGTSVLRARSMRAMTANMTSASAATAAVSTPIGTPSHSGNVIAPQAPKVLNPVMLP